jgi:hypothetical protein
MSTYRITELPGKVEMTVQGVYENDKPLIIRYRSSPTETTTLTIHSVDGVIWDRTDRPARDGDLRIDNPNKEPAKKVPNDRKTPPDALLPKPIKP